MGSWSGTVEGIAVTMSFEEDGTGVTSALGGLASEPFTYTYDASTVTVTLDDETEVFDYTIDGDKLTLSNGDETLTLTKDK